MVVSTHVGTVLKCTMHVIQIEIAFYFKVVIMTFEKYAAVEDPLSIRGKINLKFLEKYPLKMNDLS